MNKVIMLEQTYDFKISTRLLMQAALSKGYVVTYFRSSPSTESGVTRCEKDGKELFFKSTASSLTPAYGVFAAENKALTYSLLSLNGVATPDTVALGVDQPIDGALKLLGAYGTVVVKPVDTNHGDGISIGVTDQIGLERAIAFARSAGGKEPDVIIQQQVKGDEYRFLVVEGKVIAVASRRPPQVTGDGRLTVKELIDQKNDDPRRGAGHMSTLTLINLDDVMQHKGEDFLKTVVPKGETVRILETSNLSKGGEAVDFTDIASPALKKLAVKAAEYCFLGIAGVDVMTKDITSDSTDDSYIIEVNLTPGIRMHQFPSEGKPRDVAKIIFEAIEKTARPIDRRIIPIGRSEVISLPELALRHIPARIDTGATVSSIWASAIQETDAGLSFTLFDSESEHYSGETIVMPAYGKRAVSSSMGHTQVRYEVKLLISLHGRRIRAKVTLADRSAQIYPILIGRNILRNKFIVNVAQGTISTTKERTKRRELDTLTERELK